MKIFDLYIRHRAGWFCIFGYGISWKHKSYGLRFSERTGYRGYLRIGNWIFNYLKRNSIN
jgi:hypothetical protein